MLPIRVNGNRPVGNFFSFAKPGDKGRSLAPVFCMPQKVNARVIPDSFVAGISSTVIDHKYRQIKLQCFLDDTANPLLMVVYRDNDGKFTLFADIGWLILRGRWHFPILNPFRQTATAQVPGPSAHRKSAIAAPGLYDQTGSTLEFLF